MYIEKIYRTVENALELPEGSVTNESSFSNTKGWDSLGHLSILVALNELFKGKAEEIQELGSALSVKSICQILKKNSLI